MSLQFWHVNDPPAKNRHILAVTVWGDTDQAQANPVTSDPGLRAAGCLAALMDSCGGWCYHKLDLQSFVLSSWYHPGKEPIHTCTTKTHMRASRGREHGTRERHLCCSSGMSGGSDWNRVLSKSCYVFTSNIINPDRPGVSLQAAMQCAVVQLCTALAD